MLKKQHLLRIDDARCTGCGNCVSASHGAIVLRRGKAHLRREAEASSVRISPEVCPAGAIYYVERTAGIFALGPGHYRELPAPTGAPRRRGIRQWPLELDDFTGNEPFWAGARVVLASPGAAVACPEMWDECVLVICPRRSPVDHLAEIFSRQPVSGIAVVRHPGGDGLLRLAKAALSRAGKRLPVENLYGFLS